MDRESAQFTDGVQPSLIRDNALPKRHYAADRINGFQLVRRENNLGRGNVSFNRASFVVPGISRGNPAIARSAIVAGRRHIRERTIRNSSVPALPIG